ncbi:diguanylate cyclase [Marinomonas rhizomae]|uniref:diguanylate cyclase n=1 Tax=Marinomonas rhizomae TaxID=491948 RepID=A0A366J0K1_9GAMM|nr:diguanylate cyclase [Marinomonas rhizomae]RBP80576.1 response regulator receiver modulated diguanylate cyclase [Marinomonas rhizomae]RNF71807.1 diguanylate cyclase [Marinomonas rhizomae]
MPMRVLIVDDTNTDRLLLKLHLSKLGYRTIEASNGQAAIDQFLAHSQDLDLILMDVQMPFMNGFDAVRSIRKIQEQQKQEWLPVIFLSASAEDDDVEDGILAGGDDYLIKPISQKVLSAKMLAMQRIADMRRRLVESNRVLEELASTDYLTGVANRRAFEVMLDREMSFVRRYGSSMACAMFDLDKFKVVNDTYGHDAGDAVLVEVVNRIKGVLREEDIIGRLGGEEFGIILPKMPENELIETFERYRCVVAEHPVTYGDIEIPITASIGVALYSGNKENKIELLKRADDSLYEAKETGRNRVVYHPQ